MNPKTAAKWIEAHLTLEKIPGVPALVRQETAKQYHKAMRKAVPAKPVIRLPRGSKPVSVKALKKKAWDAFSKFIRQRDADENGNVKCCTCPNIKHWKEMQAGHFVSRVYESVFFDENNVWSQCPGCNMPPNNGRPILFARFLDEKYGAGAADRIAERAHRRTMKRQELEFVLKKYSNGEAPATPNLPTPPTER